MSEGDTPKRQAWALHYGTTLRTATAAPRRQTLPSLAPVARFLMSFTLTSWLVLTNMLYRKLSSIQGARSPT